MHIQDSIPKHLNVVTLCGNPVKTHSTHPVKVMRKMQETSSMQKSHQTSSTSIDSNDKRIDKLFARLSAIYGHVWQSQYKSPDFFDLAKKEWLETLQIITDKNIELAFKTCKERYEYPPTLPAFYQLCISFQPIKPSNYFKPYETKAADPLVAEKHLKKISEIINKNKYK